jgi:hypothetical protein
MKRIAITIILFSWISILMRQSNAMNSNAPAPACVYRIAKYATVRRTVRMAVTNKENAVRIDEEA